MQLRPLALPALPSASLTAAPNPLILQPLWALRWETALRKAWWQGPMTRSGESGRLRFVAANARPGTTALSLQDDLFGGVTIHTLHTCPS